MVQQGQVFQLTRCGPDGERLWAYRYRTGGRDSKRVQRGIDVNPAKVGVDNPARRRKEQHPFESWGELEDLASAIGPRYGPMILFAAATGLRPAEWIALEKRDVDRDERVVYVRRSFTKRELKHPKTEASMRAVPLQARALDALDRIEDGNGSPLLFPGERGGYLDIHHFRPFQWRPAQEAAGSRRFGASTISGTPSRPSRCVPASRPSTSPATWVPA
jgi:integrase